MMSVDVDVSRSQDRHLIFAGTSDCSTLLGFAVHTFRSILLYYDGVVSTVQARAVADD